MLSHDHQVLGSFVSLALLPLVTSVVALTWRLGYPKLSPSQDSAELIMIGELGPQSGPLDWGWY